MTNPGTTLEPGNIVLIPSKMSWIRTDKLFTLSSEIVVKNFGAVRPDVFKQVMQAICRTIGCTPR